MERISPLSFLFQYFRIAPIWSPSNGLAAFSNPPLVASSRLNPIPGLAS